MNEVIEPTDRITKDQIVNFKALPSNRSGAEKDIFEGVYKGRPAIIKVYRPEDIEGVPVDQSREAMTELAAYRMLKDSPLGEYIPNAYGLYQDESGKITGLVIEKKEGDVIGALGRVVPKDDFDRFETALLSLTQVLPYSDCFTDANLGFGGGQLWIAECKVSSTEKYHQMYPDTVKRIITGLRNLYQI